MDDMHTRNSGSMHDELVRMTEAEILILFDYDYDSHTYTYIQHSLDVDVKILNEALDNLVSKELLWRSNHYYELPQTVRDEVDRITHIAIANSNLLHDGKEGG